MKGLPVEKFYALIDQEETPLYYLQFEWKGVAEITHGRVVFYRCFCNCHAFLSLQIDSALFCSDIMKDIFFPQLDQ